MGDRNRGESFDLLLTPFLEFVSVVLQREKGRDWKALSATQASA